MLYKRYGDRNWWPANDEFEMMTGAILTQNTNWRNVEKAIENFNGNLSPDFILSINLDELIDLIRPSGFYNQKAKRLIYLASWFKSYKYDVENIKKLDSNLLRKELLSIKGIGKETADSILLYAFEKPYFVIDKYTRRMFERVGYLLPKDYDDFRFMIQDQIKEDVNLYNQFHALIVENSKNHCLSIPNCIDCPIDKLCKYNIDNTAS